jgi:hypothetical protein
MIATSSMEREERADDKNEVAGVGKVAAAAVMRGGAAGDEARARYVRGESTRSNVTTRLPWNMATVKMRKTEGGGTSTSASCGTALRARMRTPRTRVKLNNT